MANQVTINLDDYNKLLEELILLRKIKNSIVTSFVNDKEFEDEVECTNNYLYYSSPDMAKFFPDLVKEMLDNYKKIDKYKDVELNINEIGVYIRGHFNKVNTDNSDN